MRQNSGCYFGVKNGQHGLHILRGVTTQAGQVTAIRLVGQFFFKEAFGGGNVFRGSGLMNFQTFLGTVQVEECEDFQFGSDIRTPDFLGIGRQRP